MNRTATARRLARAVAPALVAVIAAGAARATPNAPEAAPPRPSSPPPSVAAAAPAARPREIRAEHDLFAYGLVVQPPAVRVTVHRGIEFKRTSDASGPLVLDLALPPAKPGAASPPVVIFVNGVGDDPTGKPLREWGAYRGWSQLVASFGMAGVTFGARHETADNATDIADVFRYVHDHAAELGVDGSRLAAWACSANVRSFLSLLSGDDLPPLKGAVLYYGAGDGAAFRADVPVLFVRAGRDRREMNDPLDRLAAAAFAANAPWSVINLPDAHHAFDVLDDTDEARAGIRQTLEFLQARLGVAAGANGAASPALAAMGPPPASAPAASRAGGARAAMDGAGAPYAPPPLARRAMAHFFGREWDLAATDYTAWVADHPDDGDAHLMLGNALIEAQRFEEARAALGRAVELLPDLGEPLALLGRLEADARKPEAAEPLLRRAIALMPTDAEARYQLGKLLAASQRNEEAARELEEAVRLAPGNGFAWSSLAGASMAMRQYPRAIEAYRHVLEFVPNHAGLLYNLSCALSLAGRADEGWDALSRSVENGFRDANLIATDPDIAPLRGRPGFPDLAERVRRNREGGPGSPGPGAPGGQGGQVPGSSGQAPQPAPGQPSGA